MTIDELGYDVIRLGHQLGELAEASRQEFAGIRHEFATVHTEMRGILRAGETLDLGSDLGSPVSLEYKTPYRFTGEIEKVSVELK